MDKIYSIIFYDNGVKVYLLNDDYHREDGPARIHPDGYKEWWLNGQLHREDGPAVEWYDYKAWYLNGKLHREDGPAVEWYNGYKSWYKNGKKLNIFKILILRIKQWMKNLKK